MLDARMVRHSGIGTYVRGLLGEYRNHPFFNEHSLGVTVFPSLVSEFSAVGKNPETFSFRSPIYSLQEQIEYPFHLRRCRLWHSPHYNAPLLKNGARLVVTFHDLIHWIFRATFYSSLQTIYAKHFIKSAIRKADRIITVSKKTREDLINYFGAPYEKIRVIYEGVAPQFFSMPGPEIREAVLKKFGISDKFFLYIGLVKPHKNVKRLLSVFTRLRREKRLKASLVIIGKKDKHYRVGYEELKHLKTGDGIYYLPSVHSPEELSCFYGSAVALVHPSLYEGFGLTVLEAMASGLPVIASDAGSLPEVAGDAAYFVDPRSEESIAEAMVRMENDEELRSRLGEKGKKQAKKFSWKKAAQETISVYGEVLREQ